MLFMKSEIAFICTLIFRIAILLKLLKEAGLGYCLLRSVPVIIMIFFVVDATGWSPLWNVAIGCSPLQFPI